MGVRNGSASATEAKPGTLRRRTFLGLLGASAPLGMAGAALVDRPVRASAAPVRGGTLVYGLQDDLDNTLDPQVTDFDVTIRVMVNVCEPLVIEPSLGRFYPGLAASWNISPDGKVYTFHLKQGVRFHDGTPFTAEAVQFTMDRAVDPATRPGQAQDQLGPYDHTEVVDDYTARIVLKEPYAGLLTNLNGYLGIVSPTAVKKAGLAGFAQHPVGTGPFIFKEWVPKDHITLVRNPDYTWGSSFFKNRGPAYLDQVVFKIISEASVRTGTLVSGETHYIDQIDPLQYSTVKNNAQISVIVKPQPGSGRTLQLNMTSEGPVHELAVRQAIEFGLDREGFNKAVFSDLMKPAWSPLTRPTLGYDPAAEKIYSFDPAKAKTILDEAGWKAAQGGVREKDGRRLILDLVAFSRPLFKAMAESVQASLTDVGIDVNVELLEPGAAHARFNKGQYDANFQWLAYGDPDVLRALFHTQQSGYNRSHYSVPEVDKWLEEADATQSRTARQQLYALVQERVLRDAAIVPLVDMLTYNGKRNNVQGDYLDALADYVYLNDTYLSR